MYIVTTLTFDQLGALIRDKRVSLDNGELMFGQSDQIVDQYFKEKIGYEGYVIGLRGRLNRTTADIFSKIDRGVTTGDRIILEAQVSDDDLLRYNIQGVTAAAEALSYGMGEEDVREHLDHAQVSDQKSRSAEVLCAPYIRATGNLRVTSFGSDIEFNVEGITFVPIK